MNPETERMNAPLALSLALSLAAGAALAEPPRALDAPDLDRVVAGNSSTPFAGLGEGQSGQTQDVLFQLQGCTAVPSRCAPPPASPGSGGSGGTSGASNSEAVAAVQGTGSAGASSGDPNLFGQVTATPMPPQLQP